MLIIPFNMLEIMNFLLEIRHLGLSENLGEIQPLIKYTVRFVNISSISILSHYITGNHPSNPINH